MDSPLTVWREFRGLTVKTLAQKAGIMAAYLSRIETGKRDGTVGTMRKLAEALRLSIDDLI